MSIHPLKLLNTLSKKKEPFTSNSSNIINWYICGPTVYDSPHIGHARTYISFDAIRRIFEQYFGFEVNYVMNVTDVDDKIINKAKSLNKNGDFAELCKEVTVQYENEFFDDLKELNVRAPSFVTRVTEFIGEIEEFVGCLMKNQVAYESDGSVYFDLQRYREKFDYPLFVDKSAIRDEDEENEVVSNTETLITPHKQASKTENPSESNKAPQEKTDKETDLNNEPLNKAKDQLNKLSVTPKKKSAGDFVLWKHRETDLFYKNSLGTGRPGWHIECSAMACNIFPDGLDIHSGGIDLAFPHHENEIAQSQALIGKKWCNYFLHTGHLHIDGLKMSKSLKNFITIKEFLTKYTARQIRMSFLMNKWWMPMTYSTDSMEYAVTLENKLFTFLSVLESQIKIKNKLVINNTCFNKDDAYFYKILNSTKSEVYNALCDNIDTSEALKAIFGLIQKCNQRSDALSVPVMRVIYEYVYKITDIFGFIPEKSREVVSDDGLLSCLNQYRNDVRSICKKKGEFKEFYEASDRLRDKLKENGYIIEDKKNESNIRKIN